MRTVALLLSGVLPLAIQPGALAGQIVASRSVDRMVSELPEPLSIEELARLLAKSAENQSSDDETDEVPADVMAVIAQCKLMSMMSESVVLQAPDLDVADSGLEARDAGIPAFQRNLLELPADPTLPTDRLARRLSDEQPLGP